MSFFSDLFGGASNAAGAQTAGINAGLGQASYYTNAANQTLDTATTQGLGPALANNTTAQSGIGALGNVLGLNGPSGTQSANTALQTMPGYQAALGGGEAAINAGAAASGNLNSGNQSIALQNMGQNTASQNYSNYVSQLQPYLGFGTSASSQIGGLYGAEGQTANSNLMNMANLEYGGQTGIGNANASADLANQSLGLGLLGGGLSALTGGLGGGLGGSLMSGLGQLGASATGGGVGSFTNGFGAAPTFSLFGTHSDERLKENIEPVGELYDGQQVYRYNYIDDLKPHIGLMAQEVLEDNPHAVGDMGGGWLGVDYGLATNRAAELARFLDAA